MSKSRTADFYGVADVARITGLSKQMITKRHRRYGIGKKIGASLVFTPAELATMKNWPHKVGRPVGTSKNDG